MIEPSFTLYYNYPQTLAVINVDVSSEGPYNVQKLTKGTCEVVKVIGSFLERTYKVKTSVETPKDNILLTKIQPVTAELKEGEYDLDIKNIKNLDAATYIDGVCRRLIEEKTVNAFRARDNGFLIFQLLEKQFDPESTKSLLDVTETLLLTLFNQKCIPIKSEICPDYLEHDIEIIKPPTELYS